MKWRRLRISITCWHGTSKTRSWPTIGPSSNRVWSSIFPSTREEPGHEGPGLRCNRLHGPVPLSNDEGLRPRGRGAGVEELRLDTGRQPQRLHRVQVRSDLSSRRLDPGRGVLSPPSGGAMADQPADQHADADLVATVSTPGQIDRHGHELR